jgi:hypothetical protein
MLSLEGMRYFETAPWMAFAPGVFISAAVFGANLFGDALATCSTPSSAAAEPHLGRSLIARALTEPGGGTRGCGPRTAPIELSWVGYNALHSNALREVTASQQLMPRTGGGAPWACATWLPP